jgi:hypothetical protein
MLISRRLSLRILIGAGTAATDAARNLFSAPALFEVDRLADAYSRSSQAARVWQRRYRASATVTLLSIPVFSRADVGTGFTVIEDGAPGDTNTVAIQFGAGSWPETAHGLNRLGYIQEVVIDNRAGEVAECAYFAFMTSSQEKNLDQAKKALETTDGTIPYAAAEGIGKNGAFRSRLDRIAFPSKLTWRDYPVLIEKVRSAMASEAPRETASKEFGGKAAVPATFLYLVRKALQSPATKTSAPLIYNGKEFRLDTAKESDPGMGEKMAVRGIARDAARVMRLNATLYDFTSRVTTPFKVWYETGAEHLPPLRFEYQARSFLRLAFEYDPAASGPPLVPSLANNTSSKENS